MFNQRGQAFSVFELMIAAIVAIAILFVLLPIITNISGGGAALAPKDAISNALASIKNGGSTTTQVFELSPDLIITSQDFSEKGFDPHSILFDRGEFSDTQITANISATGEYYLFTYDGSTKQRAKANVYCQLTGTALLNVLTDLTIEADAISDIEALCQPNGEEGEYQPCCLVVLKRA